jgi:hypothetical protein
VSSAVVVDFVGAPVDEASAVRVHAEARRAMTAPAAIAAQQERLF